MEHVIIGVDPHKLSATIEVVDHHEKLLGLGRFTTDRAGYAAMREYVVRWPDRVWAIEGEQRSRSPTGAAPTRGRRTRCGRPGEARRPGPAV
jgi:transposase